MKNIDYKLVDKTININQSENIKSIKTSIELVRNEIEELHQLMIELLSRINK